MGQYAAANEWAAALSHLDRVIEADPACRLDRIARGRIHAMLNRWEPAAADFAAAIAAGADDAEVWNYYALLRHQVGETDGYRKACQHMLRFGQTGTPSTANDMAWACLLVPGAVADATLPLRLAEKAMASDPKNANYLNTLGAALYRAGKFPAAVQRLNEAIKLRDGNGDWADWMFLAMAHHRLGHKEEARQWLDRAVAWSNQAGRLSWSDRLQVQMLRREAEALLRR
jgi:tetratricopeptide (TPR) repeat protein